jgi:molybdopterin-guanine dinucleotide biosynthesis protein A
VVKRAFVLAGGASQRFGQEKSTFVLDGKPMVMHVVTAFQAAGLSVSLVVRDTSLLDLGLPLILESVTESRYPLRGVLAGLEVLAKGESALFCPCDLPFLSAQSVAAMAASPVFSVASDGERVHPLLAHFSSDAQEGLRSHIVSQSSAMSFVVEAHRVVLPSRDLRNINRPEDLILV